MKTPQFLWATFSSLTFPYSKRVSFLIFKEILSLSCQWILRSLAPSCSLLSIRHFNTLIRTLQFFPKVSKVSSCSLTSCNTCSYLFPRLTLGSLLHWRAQVWTQHCRCGVTTAEPRGTITPLPCHQDSSKCSSGCY